MAEPGGSHLSIGEVLGLLLEEFPDVTISKIRFLESQGLIEPERTPSGYRKFFHDDVELLRLILREQREKFLPLRVIKDRIDSGEIEPSDPTPPKGAPEPEGPTPASLAKHPSSGRDRSRTTVMAAPAPTRPPPSRSTVPSTPATPATPTGAPPAARDEPAPARRTEPASPSAATDDPRVPGVLVNRDELCALAAVTPDELSQLEEYGVVARRGGSSDLYGDDAVEIVAAAGGFLRAGVDARHLRSFRTSAERESGLYEQLILPALRQRNPQARSQAAERLRELDALGARLRAALTRSALRRHLEV
ncbi:MAG: MerR family transcriptional regulator [Ilumatobacteraceae bacterium]